MIAKSYRKTIMPFKTTVYWLFNDIWCYLVIGCFDWKIGVFQQAVVRVYYILNEPKFREILSLSSGNVNDYVAHVSRK